MSKTNAAETAFLELLFENTDWANIGDATGLQGSTAAGNLYIALFTADPTDAGTVTNEATYTGYARKAVPRDGSVITVTGDTATNDQAEIAFDPCTAGSNTITHYAVCRAGTASVQDLIIHGALSASLAVSAGITPRFATSALTFTED